MRRVDAWLIVDSESTKTKINQFHIGLPGGGLGEGGSGGYFGGATIEQTVKPRLVNNGCLPSFNGNKTNRCMQTP